MVWLVQSGPAPGLGLEKRWLCSEQKLIAIDGRPKEEVSRSGAAFVSSCQSLSSATS